MSYISVIGAGSWGTVLAHLLGEKGYDVILWSFEKELAMDIHKERVNAIYMPDIKISENIIVTHDLKEAVEKARYILFVVPAQFIRNIFNEMSLCINNEAILITATKGIEKGSLKTVSAIIREFSDNKIAVLSGPSFAKEVVQKKPTAVTLAVEEKSTGLLFQEIFNTNYFRVYTHNDILGVELGGALKNVIAIASGIADGLELGHNARAALITRGLAEMVRLGVKLGARETTFMGLSGLGDLILTCTGKLSRNYTVGTKLGKGSKLHEILSDMHSIAEGIETSASAYELSKREEVEMPIVDQVYSVIHKGKNPEIAVQELMARELKQEF